MHHRFVTRSGKNRDVPVTRSVRVFDQIFVVSKLVINRLLERGSVSLEHSDNVLSKPYRHYRNAGEPPFSAQNSTS
jgi:hypothetical protein